MNNQYDSPFDDNIFESVSRFEEMVNRNSTCYFDVHEYESIADYYIDQHNFHNAIQAIEKGLRQHPHSSSLKLRMAEIYIRNGKPSKGLYYIREIEPVEKSNNELYLLKGTALNILGRKDEAHNAFDRAINLTSDGKDEIIFNIACSYLNTGRYNLAIKYLRLAHEINPRNLMVIHEMALAYEKTDLPDKSIEYYQKYLEIDPYAENIWLSIGMAYVMTEQFEKAVEAYDFAIAIYPGFISAYFSKANIYAGLDRYREAIDVYEQILDFEPDNLQAYICIGECYEKLEQFRDAIRCYKKVIRLDHHCSDAWYGMGMAYFNMGESKISLGFLKKANATDPENPDYWFMLGEVYRKLGNIENSAESYSHAVELDPNDYLAWLSYAEMLFAENLVKEAISILNKAFEYNREIATINYFLGVYYLYDDQPNAAHLYFERGLLLNYDEHKDIADAFPPVTTSKDIVQLIKKYKKLSQEG